MRWLFALLMALAGCRPGSEPPPDAGCRASPLEIDFGAPRLREQVSREVVVSNDSQVLRELVIPQLSPPFTILPCCDFAVPPRGSIRFMVTFTATEDPRLLTDKLSITEKTAGEGACDFTIPVRGLGAGGLSVDQHELQFGQIEPDVVLTRELRVHNSRRSGALTVETLVGLQLPGAAITLDPRAFELPAQSSATITVTLLPLAPGPVSGEIVFLPRETGILLSLPVSFTVGKPMLEVTPAALTPWRVGLAPGTQVPSFSNRRLRVRNAGTSGESPALRLRFPDPPIDVEVLQGSSAELSTFAPSALVGGLVEDESAEIVVHLRPLSVGPKEFRLTLFTNEPMRPVTEVMVRAMVEVLPSCDMTVRPDGMLELSPSDGGVEGNVTFTNQGTTPCLIDDVHLGLGTLESFSIVGGALDQVEVPAGAAHVVTIVGPAQPSTSRIGTLEYHVFNPDTDTRAVVLRAP